MWIISLKCDLQREFHPPRSFVRCASGIRELRERKPGPAGFTEVEVPKELKPNCLKRRFAV